MIEISNDECNIVIKYNFIYTYLYIFLVTVNNNELRRIHIIAILKNFHNTCKKIRKMAFKYNTYNINEK